MTLIVWENLEWETLASIASHLPILPTNYSPSISMQLICQHFTLQLIQIIHLSMFYITTKFSVYGNLNKLFAYEIYQYSFSLMI